MSGENPSTAAEAETRLPAESKPQAGAPSLWLRLNPKDAHVPERYEDLEMELDFSLVVFSSLKKYLPLPVLESGREEKVKLMRAVLLKYLPHGERERKHQEYK